MRQVVLDTETTGLETERGHRIIEIGAVELVDRRLTGRRFHKYVNPQRDIDEGAQEVHGISAEFLEDKPRIADIWPEFLEFISDAELVIHNAPFDVGFLNAEIRHILADGVDTPESVEKICQVTDSLALARHKHPGQKNNLDALCRRYMVDNSQRQLHGALLDAEILADVFLLMTGGQTQLFGANDDQDKGSEAQGGEQQLQPVDASGLSVIRADADELKAHEQFVTLLAEKSGATPIWRQIGSLTAARTSDE
jgi:DNA polymerase-3 subunit epsilon